MRIILLSGYATSGKTFVSNKIVDYYTKQGKASISLALADSLKRCASEITGISEIELEANKRSSKTVASWGGKPCTVRQIYNHIGAMLRGVQSNIFVTSLLDTIQRHRSSFGTSTATFVVQDVRFLNELSYLYTVEAQVTHIHITAPKAEALLSNAAKQTTTERNNPELLSKASFVITNDYDPTSLDNSLATKDVENQISSILGG